MAGLGDCDRADYCMYSYVRAGLTPSFFIALELLDLLLLPLLLLLRYTDRNKRKTALQCATNTLQGLTNR